MEDNDTKVLNLYPIDYPFETLVGRIKAVPPKLILDPEFQRKFKWDKEGWGRASRFIESCLMRIPLPACYFAETDDGKQLVIDGVQRMTTITKFFDDEFALEGLTTFKELEGKTFSQLGDLQSELESTTIRCIILRKENPKYLIQEIFSRLNQGAVSLSSQEIRHAIYPGKLDKLLTELSQVDTIKEFGIGENSQREKNSLEDEEQVLRFFALQEDLANYQDKLNKFLDDYMEQNQDPPDEKISELRELFGSSLARVANVFGDEAFIDMNRDRRRQSMVYYDLLMWSFSKKTDDFIESNKVEIKNQFREFCTDVELQKTLSGGLQNKSSILKRRDLWEQRLSSLNG
jgi:uncharacterized protein with ParB-like and HNH nuclease domain